MSTEESHGRQEQAAPQAAHGGTGHAPAANPEQHLQEAHNLVIKVQGKQGARGYATWALVKQEKNRERTLAVFSGYHRQAVVHFYDYIHPDKGVMSAPERPARAPRRASSRTSGGAPRRGGGRS